MPAEVGGTPLICIMVLQLIRSCPKQQQHVGVRGRYNGRISDTFSPSMPTTEAAAAAVEVQLQLMPTMLLHHHQQLILPATTQAWLYATNSVLVAGRYPATQQQQQCVAHPAVALRHSVMRGSGIVAVVHKQPRQSDGICRSRP